MDRLGRRGIDDFIICRDPASTVYQAIVPRITAKKVVIREKTATHQSRVVLGLGREEPRDRPRPQ